MKKERKEKQNSNIKKLFILLIIIIFIIILIIQNNSLIKNIKDTEKNSNNSTNSDISELTIQTDAANGTANETAKNAIIFEVNSNLAKEEQLNSSSNQESKEQSKVEFVEVLKSTTPYYIRVNNAQNVVNIFKKGEDGKHNIPYKVMLCSTGTFTPTCNKYPKKAYKMIGTKYRWATLQQNVYGQYATQITGNILFHSVPYSKYGKAGSLEYWEYDKLGTKASLGCIRLKVEDAKWIYENITAGTVVEFYKDDDPGPMGKPDLEKISDNEECRNWDPTDTNENNPWNQD